MDYKLNVGDRIPLFRAKDAKGRTFTQDDVVGGPLVLYFYPKDETPGCTKEACSFRDLNAELEKYHALVIGVSPDSADSHQNFIKNHQLNFTLFCDENLELCHKFDVVHPKDMGGIQVPGIERTTFVINALGIIRWIERPVKVENHAERVLEAVRVNSNEYTSRKKITK